MSGGPPSKTGTLPPASIPAPPASDPRGRQTPEKTPQVPSPGAGTKVPPVAPVPHAMPSYPGGPPSQPRPSQPHPSQPQVQPQPPQQPGSAPQVMRPPRALVQTLRSNTGQFVAAPTGQFPAAPTGQFPAAPAGQFQGGGTGQFPAAPSQPGQGYPNNHAMSMPRITVQYPQVGAVLTSARGHYEVRSIVGSGEFGAVYECVGPFDQVYAVKMIRPANRPYGDVYAEWAREVQRLMLLRHPNVVFIYDAFEQNFLFYLALERCDHPLTEMLGNPMQEGLVIELARQLLAAVQFLHDQDVVHDDLHPGNVLISHTDRPIVKISDFGISHELRGAPAIRPNVVHHKIMAPEVVASGYTSKQSDLYQIGLLLYWMIAGTPALPVGLPYQELVRQVSDGEPRRRAEQIGTPLGQLIAKMLRRREAYRYTSAREVWADLRELTAWKNRDLFRGK